MSVPSLSGGARPAASPFQPDSTDQAKARVIAALKARDRQVRAHEAAHLAAAGGLARGGAAFTYERGPDGQNYAVGGEVTLDTSAVPGDPAATLTKAQQIAAAALAPADPSPQDRSIAAGAMAMAAEAQRDLQRLKAAEALGQNLDVVA